jgi:2'-5' RNA ligase
MTYEVEMPTPDQAGLVAAAVSPTTGMIALRPADPDAFVVDGGDQADELHVTMTFLGEVDDDLYEAARKAAEKAADAASGPFTARVAGYGVLGEEDAVVLFLNGSGFAEIRAALDSDGNLAAPEQWEPWICHMTLGYGIDVSAAKQFIGREFEIDALSVDVGDNHDRFVLGGSAVTVRAGSTREASVTKRTFQLEEEGRTARWRGVMVVEDTPTGDGRQFAKDALTWPDLPLPLQWQKETTHGGMNDVVVTVGTIEAIERNGNNEIVGEGLIDLGSEDGREVYRRIDELGLGGVSIVADDPEQADVEYVYPEGCADLDDLTRDEIESEVPVEELEECFWPILMIFHSGRIRALTVVDTPAFVEAKIEIVDEAEVTAAVTMPIVLSFNGHSVEIGEIGSPADLPALLQAAAEQAASGELISLTAVARHETGTTDDPWDASANVGRLDSPMSTSTAERMYAWIDRDQVEDGEVTKSACKFPHHMVGENGSPGVANLQGCRSGIGVLNGGRGGADIPSDDRQGIYNHLAGHIRDAGEDPPELRSADDLEETEAEIPEQLVAAAYTVTIPDLPPLDWYTEPAELPPIGAIRVTPEGRFYGLLAPKDIAHRGFADKRVTVPMGNVDYSRFMSRQTPVALADGTVEDLPAGVVTMNCGHAKTTGPNASSADAALEHYDNSCSIAATIRIGESKHGVWVAGALTHGIEAKDLARLLGCQLSGDWRPHPEKPGMRELTAALLVPVPGFAASGPTVRIEDGQLVAASAPIRLTEAPAFTGVDDTTVQTIGETAAQPETAEETGTETGATTEIEVELPEGVAEEIVETYSGTQIDAGKIHDGYVEDLPDFEEALRTNDPVVQAAALAAEVRKARLDELVASVRGAE